MLYPILHAVYKPYPAYYHQVSYAFFPISIFGDEKDHDSVCVFTAMHGGITHAEHIVDRIHAVNGLDWRHTEYAELQTHRNYRSRSPGRYGFHRLEFGDKPRHGLTENKNKCNKVVAWNDVACPKMVYDVFQEYIGTHPPLESFICRDGKGYATYTDEQIATDLEEGRKWWKCEDRMWNEERKERERILLTPDAASKKGFVFHPRIHRESSVDPRRTGGVWVDMTHSHWYGQSVDAFGEDNPYERIPPFAFWTDRK